MEESRAKHMSNPATSLPPGFRFYPTDEELILHYLKNRAASTPYPVSIIAEVDIYKFDPWDLPGKAMFGDSEWYFFTPRDRKYPNGVRPNRAAASGYWKATGTDKPIHSGNENIGVKKALVFYKGRPPMGLKTSWIMHEYRLAEPGNSNNYKPLKLRDQSMRLDDWVLCRIYKKSKSWMDQEQEEDSCSTEELAHLSSFNHQNTTQQEIINNSNSLINLPKSSPISEFLVDYSSLSHLYDTQPEFNSLLTPSNPNSNQLVINGNINNGAIINGSNHNLESPSKRQRTMDYRSESSSSQFDGSYYSFVNQQLLLLNSHLGFH